MNHSRKKNFVIISNDELLLQRIEKFKTKNQKLYQRILEALQLLGNFPPKIEVELYDSKDTDEEKYSRVWCSDLDGNILIFYLESSIKKSETIIEKLTNECHRIYDLSLAKKFKLRSENIDLIQTSKVLSFKFGRLITDEKCFYNLFLGNNVCYQIKIGGNQEFLEAEELLPLLNKLETTPTFKNYIDIFEKVICDKSIDYNTMFLGAYKNFESMGTLIINDEKTNIKVLSK